MADLSGLPYFPLEFDKAGGIADPAQLDACRSHIASGTAVDLVVISHGWNNDMAEAEALYRDLFANVAAVLGGAGSARGLAVLGVLWPSKKFAEAALVPGRGANAAGLSQAGPDEALLAEQLDDLAGIFDHANPAAIKAAKECIGRLEELPQGAP